MALVCDMIWLLRTLSNTVTTRLYACSIKFNTVVALTPRLLFQPSQHAEPLLLLLSCLSMFSYSLPWVFLLLLALKFWSRQRNLCEMYGCL